MPTTTQKILSIATRGIIITSLAQFGQVAISSAQAAVFCPCFSATIIDATIAELSGGGIKGLLNGTNGSFTCNNNGDEVSLRFDSTDPNVSISVFGEITSGTLGPGCGWSGRPLDTTAQEARECQNQITESWAWEVLGCPNQ